MMEKQCVYLCKSSANELIRVRGSLAFISSNIKVKLIHQCINDYDAIKESSETEMYFWQFRYILLPMHVYCYLNQEKTVFLHCT